MMRSAIAILCTQLVLIAKCERIHFTNSPSHLAHNSNDFSTYKLDIPGSSDSITIIEANQSGDVVDIDRIDGDSQIGPDHDHQPEDVSGENNSKKTVYAPTLLTRYLNEYNRKYQTNHNNNNDDNDESHVMAHDDADNDDGERSYYPKREEKYNLYNDEGAKHQYNRPQNGGTQSKHPFQDSKGWVTLEAIPWSKSKVSIWKPNAGFKKQSFDSNPSYLGYPADDRFPPHSASALQGDSNNNGYLTRYSDEDHQYGAESPDDSVVIQSPHRLNHINRYPSASSSTGSTSNPLLVTGGGPNDRFFDYQFEGIERNKNPSPAVPSTAVEFDDASDGRQPDRFTLSESGENFAESNPTAQLKRHPASYPDSGKGEWVLVSTTKGYNHNRSKPPAYRKANGSNEPPLPTAVQNQTTYRVHKALKLTVLPPKDTSKKMILSHGGLIEIASSNHNRTHPHPTHSNANQGNFIKPIRSHKGGVFSSEGRKKHPKKNGLRLVRGVKVNNQKVAHHDKAAILAAVGAGMVPAGVAMLMPFLGKK